MIKDVLNKLTLPTICIYQMGKVGSSSLKASLAATYSGMVLYGHSTAMFSWQQRLVLHAKIWLGLPVHVICPIREPISRDISAFFQNFSRDTGQRFVEGKWDKDQIRDLFLICSDHREGPDWFKTEFAPLFGINVFATPFPVEQKWDILLSRGTSVLIYRTDLPRERQLELISQLIGRPLERFSDKNVSVEKPYGAAYSALRETFLSDLYLDMMVNSEYFRHFWSAQEIEGIARKWRAGTPAASASGSPSLS